MNPAIELLQPYPFERLRDLLSGAQPPRDLPHIALSIGEPKHAAPPAVVRALSSALDPSLTTYPTTAGLPELRAAIADWLGRRYGLPAAAVDADSMVLPVNGTREALFAFAQAAVDRTRDPLVVMPNPCYQIYEGAALLAGAEPHYIDADPALGFAPDLDAVPAAVWRRCQLLYLCSPDNPTGAVLTRQHLARALELAETHDFVIAADECYADLYLDESQPPPGLLEVAWQAGRSRFERCVVFHSLSKRSSVPGLRSGFVAGDPTLLGRFLRYRTYHGCSMPLHTQHASIAAWSDDDHARENRDLYRQKFAAVLPILGPVLDIPPPRASFYLWPAIPGGDDEAFARNVFERCHVTVVPGSYLARTTERGNPGRGRLRISLVASVQDCQTAALRIRDFVRSG
ncbi:MAG TPA: succinyldiaminopimelate transaminase [Steroidobacteraceae bacterium]|nr:succinyldiaminopimelate transaminase [Steroidobacteraceae bacterium]